MKTYKVFLTELVEQHLILTIDAVSRDMAEEIAKSVAGGKPWYDQDGEYWADSDGAEVYAVEEAGDEAKDRASHLQVVRTDT